jgi:LPXTG-motif cell wall-anchored protein
MGKWFGPAAAAAVLAVGALESGAAAAGHSPEGSGTRTGAPCSPSGTSLALAAENHAFDKDCLAVRAGEAFTIRFENRDSDRHNVAILPSHTSTETLFQGDIMAGPKNTVYAVPNMKAGTYHFHCEIHPNLMNGTFLVAAAPTATSAAKPSTTPSPTMSMGEDTPAAAPSPAPKAADTTRRGAASAPAAPASGTATGSAAAPKSATAAGDNLPRTGSATSRLLLLLAGLALAAGGLSVLGGARRDTAS